MTDPHRIVRDNGLEWREYFRLDAYGSEIITGFELIEQPYTEEDHDKARKSRKVWKARQTRYRRKNGIRDHIPEHMGFSDASEDQDEITLLLEAHQLPQN